MEDWVLVEEADYKSTAELCGKMGDDKTLDNFIPKSESDFTEYAELVAHKLRPYEKSYHYIGLLKAVMRLSTVSLKGSDAKDVFSCLNDDMIIRSYEDEPVTSFLKKDNKRESTWDDADMDDRFIWPVEPDFASDEELIVPNKAVGNTNSNQNDEQIVEQDWSSDEELIGPNEAFGNTNSNQLSETITKIDWNLWPEYRVWFSEEEIDPNDEVVEDTDSYQHNNLVQLDPEVWLQEQEKVWVEMFNRLQVTNDDMNLSCF
ncbi:hypothetical protein CASFOL_031759 [Castilleja foliolosa]|uniref:Uncharacterized protein n=1 Tax=Castilleja foliolosa TaxID=1961234 RepID=A0ABD3C7J2_9LAMI